MGIFDFFKSKKDKSEKDNSNNLFEKLKDVNLKITELYQDFQKKIAKTDDDTGESLTYWYDIIKKRVSTVPLRKDSSFDLQVKELVYGNYDEYKRRDDLIDAPADGLESFSKMRIFSFGEIYSQLILLEKKINELLSNNSIKSNKITEQLNNELAQAKSGVYGAIKYALSVNISKNRIKEWFPGFLDDKDLIQGVNPFDSIAEKYNIDLPSSTAQYELSEEEKDNIPEWYTGTVDDEGSVIKDEETGKEIHLSPIETSIYNLTKMNNLLIGNMQKDIESGKANKIILESPIYHDMMEQLEQGKLWLKENNLKAYKVLFGEPEEEGNWEDGKQEGLWKYYHENGKLKEEGNYKDGKQEGLWKEYHENGQLKIEGNSKNGEQDGLWKYYDENGKHTTSYTYKEGEIIN